MKKILGIILILAVAIAAFMMLTRAYASTSWNTDRFGRIEVHQISPQPKAVVLYFAEDSPEELHV